MSADPVEPEDRADQPEQSTLEERLRMLAIGLFFAAALVLVLSVIGAITIASSQGLGLFAPDVEQESRGLIAVGALGAGFTAAGVLAGLGGILRALVRE